MELFVSKVLVIILLPVLVANILSAGRALIIAMHVSLQGISLNLYIFSLFTVVGLLEGNLTTHKVLTIHTEKVILVESQLI